MTESDGPETGRKNHAFSSRVSRILTLTRVGLLAERVVRSFWPLWSVALVGLAALLLGLHEVAPIELVWLGMLAVPLAALVAVAYGIRRFRWPGQSDAKQRLDETLPGRPVAALEDFQAIGAEDAASRAVWQAHRDRMAARLSKARAVPPTLSLTRMDPFGLRYVALVLAVSGLIFGSIWRVDSIADMTPGQADALALGPSWEGWIEPPRYTGRPVIYLPDLAAGEVALPRGSRVTARLYGEVGALTLTETVSARLEDAGPVSDPSHDFDINRGGEIAINGAGGRVWQVVLTPDAVPLVEYAGRWAWDATGEMELPFTASDDYGIRLGRAVITLDLPEVDRRYGRTIAPEPRAPLTLDLPMPISGNRASFTEALIDDLSEHPWANLPVRLHLEVEDALGQVGRTEDLTENLPGRRFFVPMAKAIIEERQALLWNRENAPDVAAVLRAVSHQPEGFFTNEADYLTLREIVRDIETALALGQDPGLGLSDEKIEALADDLWDLALRLEEGNLANAMERLRRAQERLAEAIRNGASEDEIEALMQELREAMEEYLNQLAEQMQQQGSEQQAQNQDGETVTGDQLQELLEKLQQLMEEGRMAEAAQLLEMLRQMMENMQMAQGQQGGPGSPGEQALQGLQETLRNQQELSDDSFGELQDQFNQDGQQGQQGQQSENGQPGEGQQGQGEPGQGRPGQNSPGGNGAGSDGLGLAERQRNLRDSLQRQQESMPGNQETNEALDRAGEAMNGAEEALRDGNIAGALDQQAEAMDALRDGMEALSEQLAQQQGEGGGDGGGASGQAPDGQGEDPLGRESGRGGVEQTRRGLLPGEESPFGRAQELQDEIRRRAEDQSRPEVEKDYLDRLLERF